MKFLLLSTCLAALFATSWAASFRTLSLRDPNSCVDRCGQQGTNSSLPCQCNAACVNYNDCCSDFLPTCNTCQGRCGANYDRYWPCQCNDQCASFGNCCPDYDGLCGGSSGGTITNEELAALSNDLAASDVNGAGSLVSLNLQGQTTSGNSADKAPAPLFTSVPAEIFTRPTYAALLALYDNYVAQVSTPESVTAQEQAEEDAFLDAILATEVMQKAHQFLVSKGKADPSVSVFKAYLKEIWFGLYSRSSGVEGSSGFEHVFLGEFKNGISGFHSWVRFNSEEQLGDMNYLGYISTVTLGNNLLIEMPMNWEGVFKAISSILVGGSPELELALYTVCFLARPDALCPIQANGAAYSIQSYTLNYNGKVYVGTAYFTL